MFFGTILAFQARKKQQLLNPGFPGPTTRTGDTAALVEFREAEYRDPPLTQLSMIGIL